MADETDRRKELLATHRKLKAAEGVVKQLKLDIAPMKAAVLADFESGDVQSTKMDGMLIYLHRDLTVASKDGDTSVVVEKLRKARMYDMLGISHQKFKAWVKERCTLDDGTFDLDPSHLPPTIRDVVTLDEMFSVRIKKSV